MTSAGHHAMLEGASAPPAPAYWGLCFTAEEPNVVVNMAKTGSPPAVTLETSTDGVTWTTFDADGGTTPITLAAVGDHVFFRAGTAGNAKMASSTSAYRSFTLSGECAASGNCMSLISASDPTVDFTSTNTNAFISLFLNCIQLTSAPALPATTLATYCYYSMFQGCTSLTAAPELPAQTLANTCYANMFRGCTSLVSAPELPAQTLTLNCYSNMFNGCTSLVSAPELPAQTLAAGCYYNMFTGCTSLVSAPELPAQTLASSCYSCMFYGCTSLTAAPELPAQTLASSCYYNMFTGCTSLVYIKAHFSAWGSQTNNWVNGVAASGKFICPAALSHTESDFSASKIPPGWAVETF